MAGFDFTKLMSDPIALAGLGVASGDTLSDALKQGAVQASAYQKQQQEQADYQRLRQAEAVLPGLLPQIDMNKPNESLAAMMQAGVPLDVASKVINNLGDNVRLQKQQEMMANIFGGLAPSPSNTSMPGQDKEVETNQYAMNLGADPQKLMIAGAMTGNPQLMQMGTAFFNRSNELQKQKTEKTLKVGEVEDSLRKEYLTQSAPFIAQRDAFTRIEGAAADPSPAGDLGVIYGYMKILDPGSTVREGEFATAQNAGSVPERVRAQWNKVVSGERLIPEIREDFLKKSRTLYAGAEKQHKARIGQYTKIAEKRGLDSENILQDLSIPSEPVKITLISSDGRKRAIADNEDDAATLESQGFKRQ